MNASVYEQELAASKGVNIITNAVLVNVVGEGAVREVEFAYVDDGMQQIGQNFTLAADQVFKAIGQTLNEPFGLNLEKGKITVDDHGRTSRSGVWAGGDCATGGDDLTVTAVAEGRDAAEDIHTVITNS